jgi:hypothetical protein
MTVRITKPALNIREELSNLKKPSGVAGEAILRAETPQEQQALIGVGRRNILINGGFEVSQRGSYTSAASFNDGTYHIDRWETLRDGVTATIQHLVPVSGESSYGVKLTATSSTNGTIRLRQRLEIPNIYKWGARTFTLSARVKSNSTNARLMMYGGSSQGYAYVSGNDTHSGSGSIETLTATFTTTASVSSEFAAFVGIDNIRSASDPAIISGDYFEVYDFQMEIGEVATPFEHRSYGEELALCQRYFYRAPGSTGYLFTLTGVHATLGEIQYFPPVTMRTTPTIALLDASPYWEVYPWNTVGNNSINITSIHAGHMSSDGHGQLGIFFSATTGSYVTPALVRGTNYVIQASFCSFAAEL